MNSKMENIIIEKIVKTSQAGYVMKNVLGSKIFECETRSQPKQICIQLHVSRFFGFCSVSKATTYALYIYLLICCAIFQLAFLT